MVGHANRLPGLDPAQDLAAVVAHLAMGYRLHVAQRSTPAG
jgi:hypothetical protein